MALQFKKAKRSVAKIKIAIGGVSGSGKTMSSLLLAYGLVKAEHPAWTDAECWEHICIVDTENRSGSLYVGSSVGLTRIGEYNTVDIDPPFDAQKYVDAIHLAEQNEQCVIIIDSMSHSWNSTGGALERQQQIAARSNNSYTAWAPVKKDIKTLMDAILQSPAHIISDFRAKQEYVQEKNDKGKTIVRNVGLGLQFMDSAEFEYSTFFMLDNDHVASAMKDRTGMFSGKFITITPDTGKMFAQWLASGSPEAEQPKPVMKPASAADIPEIPDIPEAAPSDPVVTMQMVDAAIKEACAGLDADGKKAVAQTIKDITGGTANYLKVTDPDVLSKLYEHFKK